MQKKRVGEEIVEHFDSYPRAAGSAEERVVATAKYFKVKPATVKNHLRFWWPGKTYLKEFGDRTNGRVRWDRPTDDLVQAMNQHRSVAAAAKVLKTTSVTLTNALQRHGIVQKWVVDKDSNKK